MIITTIMTLIIIMRMAKS